MKSTHPHPLLPSSTHSKPRSISKFSKATAKPAAPELRPTAENALTLYRPLDGSEVLHTTYKQKENDEEDITCPYEMLRKEVEDFLAAQRAVFKQKMAELFYEMKVEQNRRFEELKENLNKRWVDFFDYLKFIGSLGPAGDGGFAIYNFNISNSTSLATLSELSID